ncbi:porin family protein [Psychroflexus sediminis]|uniref:Outer membrane protein beta-barrel domain-containing protein n=1 Tax=Psychroflexus sediminis TaxID=470826 RepID=A0A1G7V7D3_9FLAO|nr:porin family protein [Psychroflexus sediminis]SDG55673.1 Outer membrane protein beta-barrel domain-containing protein [Psychroflexus sediminis]
MKHTMKTLTCVLILGLMAFTTQAQENAFGVRGGLNLSNFFTENVNDKNLRSGLHFGVYSRSPLIDNLLYLQAGLGYSGKGAEIEGSSGQAELGLGYLELPFLASVGIADFLFIEGGAYASYLLSANVSGETAGGSSFSDDISTDNFKDFDYGLAVGANTHLAPLVVGVRYYYGLQNIIANDFANFAGIEARNSTFQVYVAFEF